MGMSLKRYAGDAFESDTEWLEIVGLGNGSFMNLVELARLYGFVPGNAEVPPWRTPEDAVVYRGCPEDPNERGWYEGSGARVSRVRALVFAQCLEEALEERPELGWRSAMTTQWGELLKYINVAPGCRPCLRRRVQRIPEVEIYDEFDFEVASTGLPDWDDVDVEDRESLEWLVTWFKRGPFLIC